MTDRAWLEYVAGLPFDFAGAQPVITSDPATETVATTGSIAGYEVVAAPVVPVQRAPISKIDFLRRFTNAELAGILTAAKSSAAVEVYVKKLDTATEVHLDHPDTTGGINALEAAGLLAAGRAAQILGA